MESSDVGARLRTSREAHGLSIDSLSRRTRVQPRILAAIEGNDISAIPPKPFGRGLVRAYAVEVGLDPDAIVREYFRRFAPEEIPGDAAPRPIETLPSRVPWAAAAIITLAIGATLLAMGRRPSSPSPRQEVGTSGSASAAALPAGTATPAAAAGVETAAPSQPARQIVVTLDVERPCWVTATADGERAVYALLQPGARETLRGLREIVVRAGDAGAVSLTVNGRKAGRLGAPGEVRTLKITRQNAETVGG